MHQKSNHNDRSFGFLRCNICGSRVDCTQAQTIEYAKSDEWPLCCDEVMRFFGGDEATDELPKYRPL
jgi:hypothetical protein